MGSSSVAFTVCVAPNALARASLDSTTSIAMTGLAPEITAPCRVLMPTPPIPVMTTLARGGTLARLTTAPKPVVTPQASRDADSMLMVGGTFTSWDSRTKTYSANPATRAFWMICAPLESVRVPRTSKVVFVSQK